MNEKTKERRLKDKKIEDSISNALTNTNITASTSIPSLTQCNNPLCNKPDATSSFSKCAKCKKVCYCSRDCQVIHWKNGHKT